MRASAPGTGTDASPAAPLQEAVHFYCDGLRLSGQFTRAAGARAGARSPTIVCIHGYTGRKEVYMPGYVRELSAAGYNTLDFHHRGFGESEGVALRNKPWDQVDDILAAVIYLRQRPEVDPERIGLYGTSFGGSTGMVATAHDPDIRCAVSVGSSAHCGRSARAKRSYSDLLDWEDMMKQDRIDRVLTGQSRRVPYEALAPSGRGEADAAHTMYRTTERYPDGYPVENYDHAQHFVPERYVDRIAPRPVLFIHTERDTIVPVAEAHSFHAHAREPKQLVIIPGANHVDVYEPRNPQVFGVVIGHMLRFFGQHLRPAA
ncbi:MAG: alpha/beta fold hydrolase [Burkholderiales bacterium]|nr:alpha/beta fold hydrolase [Burkholderiales bacterium]